MLEYLTVNKDSESITVPSVNATILNAQNAEQLTATVGLTEQVPYQFRPSADHAGIGNRETDEIAGGSLVWNQLVDPIASVTVADVSVTSNNGLFTFSGTAPSPTGRIKGLSSRLLNIVAGHKYILLTTFDKSIFTGVYITNANNTNEFMSLASLNIGNAAFTGTAIFGVNLKARTYTESGYFMVVDLTAMFGSAIADHVYSLEQATAGAGVAWFRKMFPKPYYAYNAGELLSVSGVSAHRMVGFNQWDEEWELGSYNINNGTKAASTSFFRSKNKIKIFPNTSYYFRCPTEYSNYARICYYDSDENFIGYVGSSGPLNNVFVTPQNAFYMVFWTGDKMSSPSYRNDICINLSWSGTHNGEYEPYEVHEYALDDSLTLRGIPKLNANNELYYDGDTYTSDGTVTRRYGIVDLGTLDWKYRGTVASGLFSVQSLNIPYKLSESVGFVCGKYIANGVKISVNQAGSMSDKTIALYFSDSSTDRAMYVKDSAYTNAATFKAAMSGVYLVYELETPTTETAEPYTGLQVVSDWGTEEYVTDSIVPVGHKTFYPKDIVRATEGIPYAPTADGDYTLKVTVSGGTPTYAWVAE